MRRFAIGLTGNAPDGDDLCQVTIERALNNRDKWAAGSRLDSWMYRIMRNAWIDETRAVSRRGQTFVAEEAGLSVGGDGGQEAAVELSNVGRALGKLPPRPMTGGATSASAASLRQLSEQQIAPRPRSSELFDEADVGLLPEVRRMLREAYKWPELASREVNPTAMLMRARSETNLSLSLSKYGTRRLWT